MSHNQKSEATAVPPRGLGRRTDATDAWTGDQFLAILKAVNLIPRDAVIQPRECPDGLLAIAGWKTGIEYTEAVPEAYARADAIRNRNSAHSRLDRSEYQPGGRGETENPRSSLSERDAPVRGRGWSGDAVEVEICSLVAESISQKTVKLNSHYERFDEDWLVIYVSSPGPCPNLKRVGDLMGLAPHANSKEEFDEIFVMLDRSIISLRSRAIYPESAA